MSNNAEGKFVSLVVEDDGLYLLLFPPGGEHTCKIRITLADQMLIVDTITRRLANKFKHLAGMKRGGPVENSEIS